MASPDPVIRPWKPNDHSRLDVLRAAVAHHRIAEVSGFDCHGQPDLRLAHRLLTLVADDGDGLVGGGTVFESSVAPMRWRLALHVDPGARRRGVGIALLRELRNMASGWDRRALQIGIGADAAAGLAFLARHGFCPLMRTRLGTIRPDQIPISAWNEYEDASASVQARGVTIVPYAALGPVERWRPVIAALHRSIYG